MLPYHGNKQRCYVKGFAKGLLWDCAMPEPSATLDIFLWVTFMGVRIFEF